MTLHVWRHGNVHVFNSPCIYCHSMCNVACWSLVSRCCMLTLTSKHFVMSMTSRELGKKKTRCSWGLYCKIIINYQKYNAPLNLKAIFVIFTPPVSQCRMQEPVQREMIFYCKLKCFYFYHKKNVIHYHVFI